MKVVGTNGRSGWRRMCHLRECGCVFEYDRSDFKSEEREGSHGRTWARDYLPCPGCGAELLGETCKEDFFTEYTPVVTPNTEVCLKNIGALWLVLEDMAVTAQQRLSTLAYKQINLFKQLPFTIMSLKTVIDYVNNDLADDIKAAHDPYNDLAKSQSRLLEVFHTALDVMAVLEAQRVS